MSSRNETARGSAFFLRFLRAIILQSALRITAKRAICFDKHALRARFLSQLRARSRSLFERNDIPLTNKHRNLVVRQGNVVLFLPRSRLARRVA
jgi:uncharacterized FlgJ-related protein